MGKKLTNEIIDKRLIDGNRQIKRIGNYKRRDKNIEWECLIDGYIWSAMSANIFHINRPTGCPKCSKKLPRNNEIIDQELIDNNRNIKRLDDYIDVDTSMNWKCLICAYEWKTSTDKILNCYKTGCPICNKAGQNEKELKNILIQNNLQFKYNFNIKNITNNEKYNYKIDFYLSEYKIAIELNGRQHYEPVCFGSMTKEEANTAFINQQKRDKYIEEFCIKHNVKLIIIDGRKYKKDKLNEYVISFLIPQIQQEIINLSNK